MAEAEAVAVAAAAAARAGAAQAALTAQQNAQNAVQKIRAREFFKDAPIADRHEAALLAARALIEPRQFFPEIHDTVDACMSTIATFLPPPGVAGPPSALVRGILESTISYYAPVSAPGAAAAVAVGGAAAALTVSVDTVEARERAERWLTVGWWCGGHHDATLSRAPALVLLPASLDHPVHRLDDSAGRKPARRSRRAGRA